MVSLQELLNALKDETYKKLVDKVYKIFQGEELYGSLIMCTVILALAV